MFEVGTSIAYPVHGAGIIQSIEEKEVLGEKHTYYNVLLPYSKMTVYVPIANSERIGLRALISETEIPAVWETLEGDSTPMPNNWNRRYRENTDRLKSGDIYSVAGVVRDLTRSNRKKKLSTGEKKLLGNAKLILESELMLVLNATMEEVDELVESHI